MGHRVFYQEVGDRIWDAHCMGDLSGPCLWQAWSPYGQASIEAVIDRHLHAMRIGGTEPADRLGVLGVTGRDLYGIPG
jgi:hypothetical protein